MKFGKKNLINKPIVLVSLLALISLNSAFLSQLKTKTETQCHPQCSWKCDDPHCPAICDPVCEPPKCHTSCAEPKNAICDVKCEKPECEIKCPDKGCEMFDCPKCVTVCKQPHCVTHCQAPKPECEAVCEEPRCDWKCHKPACPKPKCELVCENPNCVPKVDCCPCAMGAPRVAQPFPFFKEAEKNPNCCGCQNSQRQLVSAADARTRAAQSINDFGTHVVETTTKSRLDPFDHPVPIGDSYFENPHAAIAEFENKPPRYSVPDHK